MKQVLVAFDIDGTLRSNLLPNGGLEDRIVANEDIRTLLITLSKFKNTKILVWSGGGELYARQVVATLGLTKYVDEYGDKEYTKCLKCTSVDTCHHHSFATKIKPDIAIDDIQACELGKINLIVREK